MAKVEIIELLIDETKEEMGINAVSVVESPAIEENFIALQKHEVELKEVDTEKRILMGAALIPNKQIYRKNKDKEFYIYFSEDTVRKASELFLMRSNQNNATYEHERKMLDGMSVVESWIIEDEKLDKSVKYGFNLPKGTWMISMKVNNDEVWKKVKEGEVKGFSIEGYFVDKYDMSKNINEMDTIEKLKELIRKHDSETKLGAHKIDLALIDELKKVNENILNTLKNADNSWRAYQDYLTRADAPFKKMIQMRESLLSSTGKIEQLLKNAETQAKNLGLNVNDIPLYSVIKSNLNKKNEIISTIDSFKDPSTFQ